MGPPAPESIVTEPKRLVSRVRLAASSCKGSCASVHAGGWPDWSGASFDSSTQF